MWTWKQSPRNMLKLTRGDGKRTADWIDPDGAVGLKVADVIVSTAEILALFGTPKELVPAPGAGFALTFEDAIIHLPYNTTAYTIGTASGLSVKYTNAAGLEVGQAAVTGFLDQTADQLRYMRKQTAAGGAASAITPVANAALVLQTLTANVTVGNSPLRLRVFYRVIPTTLPG